MKKLLIPFAAIMVMLSVTSCGSKSENVVLATEQDTLSWAMGMSLAETAKSDFYDFDQKVVRQAFESALKGEKQPLDNETYQAVCNYMAFMVAQQQRQTAENEAKAADGRQDEYFAKLTQEKGGKLKKSDQGFYYEVMTAGARARAKAGERIKFDFRSINALTGDTIMQTYGNREPIVHVIAPSMFAGMYHGLQLMNAGSKYRFYFPYQTCQNVEDLPAYTPVIYEIELHEIYKD